MKKFCKFVCVIMIVIFCFAGCGTTTQTGTGNTEQVTATKNTEQTTETPAVTTETGDNRQTENMEEAEQFKTGINEFSYHIFEQMEKGENIFISPYSMAIAVSMLDNGANGETKSEIEKMLGIKDLEKWNSCVKNYLSLNKGEKAKLLTANSLWLSDKLVLSQNAETDFFNPVEKYYEAEKKQMELSSSDTVDKINSWVSDKTGNMIEELLTEKPKKDVEMILINAVYFKGEWKEKFEKENTIESEFYGKDSTSKTDMMNKRNTSCRYAVQNGIKAIELPYGDDNIVMDILLPEKEGKDINQIFSKLSKEEKSGIFTTLSETEPEKLDIVSIPKFNMEYGVEEIADSLKALGMKQAFDSGSADFSKISSGLYASSVLHKAKIEVDEQGTKAAATTGIQLEKAAAPLEEDKRFIADHPFIFVIRDRTNDMILFMGSVQNLGE